MEFHLLLKQQKIFWESGHGITRIVSGLFSVIAFISTSPVNSCGEKFR
jgi:hypothetical protein